MRRTGLIVLVAAAAVAAAAVTAQAVSDGNYDPARQHCSGAANNYTNPAAEEGCHNTALILSDGSGHEYAGAGIPQTADGDLPNALEVWADPGQGTRVDERIDEGGPGEPVTSPGSAADPASGVHFYFGADDNLNVGEHDSSPQMNNGPSDGGAIQVNAVPTTDELDEWLANLTSLNLPGILMHPLPFVDAGIGFCADGICMTAQTERRLIFDGGAEGERDAADYQGREWDPTTCSGTNDGPEDCGGVPLSDWNAREGRVYAQPGIQVYEDPDAQASPLEQLGYPIPALYVGTCGVIAGGGEVAGNPATAPESPATNGAGQIDIRAC